MKTHLNGDAGVTYEMLFRGKFLFDQVASIDDLIYQLEAAAKQLKAMKAAGVVLDDDSSSDTDDHYFLTTTDAKVAKCFDMQPREDGDEELEDDDC